MLLIKIPAKLWGKPKLNSVRIRTSNPSITYITSSFHITFSHHPHPPQQLLVCMRTLNNIHRAYKFYLQPPPLHVIPITVGIFHSMWNEFLIHPKTQNVVLIHRSDIKHVTSYLASVTSCFWLSGEFNLLPKTWCKNQLCGVIWCVHNTGTLYKPV